MVRAESDDTFDVVDPFRHTVFGRSTIASPTDVDRAVSSARTALKNEPWSSMSLEGRCAIVQRLTKLVVEHREEFARLAACEMGGPISAGRGLNGTDTLLEDLVTVIRSMPFSCLRRRPGGNGLILRKPIGVVGGIMPWNAPLRSAVKRTVPALLAGNAVVLKPPQEAPFDAFLLAELATEAGLPPGVVNVVAGGVDTGRALVAHPGVDKVEFTGSTSAGRDIASVCGSELKRVTLELGGKSAAVILDDADVFAAGKSVGYSAFRNSGQVCVALTRAVVPWPCLDEFVAGAIAAAAEFILGDPLEEATTMGPLVTDAHRNRVLSCIDTAVDEGATVVAGGDQPADFGPDNLFVNPTVLTQVDRGMRIAQEEVFGPVLSVMGYAEESEALAIANGTPYGLHGAVYSRDEHRALEVARRLESGMASVNGLPIPVTLPFGGVKASGLGREFGREGFDELLEFQSLVVSSRLAEELALSSPE